MYQTGHYGAALLAYAPLGTAVALAGNETVALVGAFVCLALSMGPDVDHQIPLLEHRGPTHTLGFALLVGAGLAWITATLLDAAVPMVGLESSIPADGLLPSIGIGVVEFAFVVGALSIVSHLFADALTPMGIRPFWPVSGRHYSLSVTKAANPVANYALFTVGTAVALAGASVVVLAG